MEQKIKDLVSKLISSDELKKGKEEIDKLLKEDKIPSTTTHYKAVLAGVKMYMVLEHHNKDEASIIPLLLLAIIDDQEKKLQAFNKKT